MLKIAAVRLPGRSPHLTSRRNSKTGVVVSGSRYFQAPKHAKTKVLVVIEVEYKNSFLVRFMSEDKKLQREPKSFSRRDLEKLLEQAKDGMVEITINNVAGYVKATCLKQFLADVPKGP